MRERERKAPKQPNYNTNLMAVLVFDSIYSSFVSIFPGLFNMPLSIYISLSPSLSPQSSSGRLVREMITIYKPTSIKKSDGRHAPLLLCFHVRRTHGLFPKHTSSFEQEQQQQ